VPPALPPFSSCVRALRLISLAILLIASGCGGGSGGGNAASSGPVNLPPSAQAGAAQTVIAGASVRLDGSASVDSDGVVSAYAWTQSEGPAITLAGADTAVATFTAPQVPTTTDLVLTLTVTDDDGATGADSVIVTVLAPEPGAEVSISGRLRISASQSLDGDTNDPFNPFTDNSDPDAPQRIDNPTTLGGYVNEPGTGAEGRSRVEGDREDFFVVDLLAGQSLDLLVAEFQNADADLYLYTPAGDLVDFSIETGERESIQVSEAGTYVVNVSIFAGATTYTLTIGASLEPAVRVRPEFVPEQAIVRLRAPGDRAQAAAMRLREIGGGPGRARLVAFDRAATVLDRGGLRLSAQAHRAVQFADSDLARRWDTLLRIKALRLQPEIASAEPNYRVYAQASVNDEAYGFQWHYPLINLPGAWETTTGSPEVIVAVVDTGILAGHPDLRGQLVPGYDFISDAVDAADGDGIDPDPEEIVGGGDPQAINFHGSHVAGTVAAAGNNRIGVAGVAYGARVMPLRALAATGGTLFDLNEAVRFAAGLPNDSGTVPARPADIINLSLAGGGFSPSSQALYDEIRRLGITVVAAAGNENSTVPSYPASYDSVISVSAVDAQQALAPYSNTGAAVDVAAPGGDGGVDLNGDGYPDGVLSTGGADGEFAYTFLSGTSMATPHVAGVLALMKSVNPELDATTIERLLREGALTDDLGAPGRDDRFGYGLINARKAIEAALNEGGGSSNVAPRLASSTAALNFASAATNLDFILRNSGGGTIERVSVTAQEPWIRVTAAAVDDAGLGQYRVTVDRDALAPGLYEGSVVARSAANDVSLRVLLAVAEAEDSDLGRVYLLLIDPDLDEPVAQALGERDGSSYRFAFPPVAPGSYQIFAGTDLDNDLLICDAGEACGSYLTIDQPLTLTIDGDREDLEFPIEYLIALPGTAAASDGTMQGLPLLQRSATP